MEKEAEVKNFFKYDTTTATITTTNILGHSALCSTHRSLFFFSPAGGQAAGQENK